MELKDTVELMLSADYKDRFLAEYHQLDIRLGKLKSMLAAWDAGTLNFTPTCPRAAYNVQVASMENYLTSLKARAAMEDIKIS